jgi:hypothetical protein
MTEQDSKQPIDSLKHCTGFWGWDSWFPLIWIYHALFDGTWLCKCEHSKWYKEKTF